jgi:hypothetical protein
MRSPVVLMLLVATAHAARADPPGLTTPAATEPAAEQDNGSYRLQTALCDVAAITMFAMQSNSDGDAAGTIGLAMYVAGGPVVHLIHHHNGRAVQSLALRVVLPLIGAAIGSALGKGACSAECDNDSDIAGAAFGVIGGAIAASAIDIGYLSRGEDAPATRPGPGPILPPAPIAPAEPHQVRVGVTFAF